MGPLKVSKYLLVNYVMAVKVPMLIPILKNEDVDLVNNPHNQAKYLKIANSLLSMLQKRKVTFDVQTVSAEVLAESERVTDVDNSSRHCIIRPVDDRDHSIAQTDLLVKDVLEIHASGIDVSDDDANEDDVQGGDLLEEISLVPSIDHTYVVCGQTMDSILQAAEMAQPKVLAPGITLKDDESPPSAPFYLMSTKLDKKGEVSMYQVDIASGKSGLSEIPKPTTTEEEVEESAEGHNCEECGCRMATLACLKRHIVTMHGYRCEKCGQILHVRELYEKHMNEHGITNPYICQVCGLRFKHLSSVNSHEKKHESDEKLQCNQCSKTYFTKSQLDRHMEACPLTSLEHKCHICERKFKRHRYLVQHLDNHQSQKYNCEICAKPFRWMRSLRDHMLMHTGQTHNCSLCNKRFTSARTLQQHEAFHMGQSPYTCPHCHKTFPYQVSLKLHLKIHDTPVNLFQCQRCHRRLRSAKSLARHTERQKCRPVDCYSCPICGLGPISVEEYRKHIEACPQLVDQIEVGQEIQAETGDSSHDLIGQDMIMHATLDETFDDNVIKVEESVQYVITS